MIARNARWREGDDDAALAARVAAGDAAAEAELVARFQAPLRTMIRRRLKDTAVVEDLSQETFRIAIDSLREGRLREGGKLAGYLWGIASNLVSRHRRTYTRESSNTALPERIDQAPTAEEDLVAGERAADIRRALARLSPRDRRVLKAFYLDHQSKAQICEKLGLRPAQFDLVKYRALKRLAAIWKEGGRS